MYKFVDMYTAGDSPSVLILAQPKPPPPGGKLLTLTHTGSKHPCAVIIKIGVIHETPEWKIFNKSAARKVDRLRHEGQIYKLVKKELLEAQVSRNFPCIFDKFTHECTFADMAELVPPHIRGKFRQNVHTILTNLSEESDCKKPGKLFLTDKKSNKYVELTKKEAEKLVDETRLMYIMIEYIAHPSEIAKVYSGYFEMEEIVDAFLKGKPLFPLKEVYQHIAVVLYNLAQLAKIGVTHNDLHLGNIVLTGALRKFSDGTAEARGYILATRAGIYCINSSLQPILFDFDYATSRASKNTGLLTRTTGGHCPHVHLKRDLVKFIFMLLNMIENYKGTISEEVNTLKEWLVQSLAKTAYRKKIHELIRIQAMSEQDRVFFAIMDVNVPWHRPEQGIGSLLCDDNFLNTYFVDPDTAFSRFAQSLKATDTSIKKFVQQFNSIENLEANIYYDKDMSASERAVVLKKIQAWM